MQINTNCQKLRRFAMHLLVGTAHPTKAPSPGGIFIRASSPVKGEGKKAGVIPPPLAGGGEGGGGTCIID